MENCISVSIVQNLLVTGIDNQGPDSNSLIADTSQGRTFYRTQMLLMWMMVKKVEHTIVKPNIDIGDAKPIRQRRLTVAKRNEAVRIFKNKQKVVIKLADSIELLPSSLLK